MQESSCLGRYRAVPDPSPETAKVPVSIRITEQTGRKLGHASQVMPRRKRHAKAVGDGVMPGRHVTGRVRFSKHTWEQYCEAEPEHQETDRKE